MNVTIDKNSNFEPKGSGKIEINARYYLTRSYLASLTEEKAFDVIDRARELQFLPTVVFSNGNERECREWVERNCDEPVHVCQLHGAIQLAITAPKLLALLEQYHQSFPTKESGKLIAEARGWTIQE
jgi:hypothetical protein